KVLHVRVVFPLLSAVSVLEPMGPHPWSPRVVAVWLALIGAFSCALVVRGLSAAPPCPPSHLRVLSPSTPPDTTPPMVFLSAPAACPVSGAVVVSACAADPSGIAGVQFKVDGTNLGAEDVTPPYSISGNTPAPINGG